MCLRIIAASLRTLEVCSRNYWVSAIKNSNQMANAILNFNAGNGNSWGPFNRERKLFIGREHTLHWIHWHISCSFVGKYGWKLCKAMQFGWVFENVLWTELLVSLTYSTFSPRSALHTCLEHHSGLNICRTMSWNIEIPGFSLAFLESWKS